MHFLLSNFQCEHTVLTLLSNGTEVCISMYIGTLLFVKHMNMFQAKANLEKLKIE